MLNRLNRGISQVGRLYRPPCCGLLLKGGTLLWCAIVVAFAVTVAVAIAMLNAALLGRVKMNAIKGTQKRVAQKGHLQFIGMEQTGGSACEEMRRSSGYKVCDSVVTMLIISVKTRGENKKQYFVEKGGWAIVFAYFIFYFWASCQNFGN